ncbi:hypothetical protein MHTCC0001_01960 [Flavobacteriaceae bacterium MHTCC 0001]
MKKSLIKIKSLLLIPCLLFIVACDEDQFLTELDPNNQTAETFWQTEQQFETALITTYAALQFDGVSGPNGMYPEMAKSDIGGTDFWQNPFTYLNLAYTNGDIRIKRQWDKLYIGIFRCNQVIQNITTVDPLIFNEGKKEEIEAQARFLRAWYYFRLAHAFNGGIKRIDVPTGVSDVDSPFVPKEELINDIVKPDLEFAINNLPQTWEDSEKGRATWGAATTLLGKVYLFEEDFAKARDAFKQVIDSNVYQLTTDFVDNFTSEGEFNSESIFEVAYNGEYKPGIAGGNSDGTGNGNDAGSEAINWGGAFGFLDKGGFNVMLGSYYLHELFIYDEVDPDNPINDGNLHSKRLTATLAVPQGEGTYYNEPTASIVVGRSGQSAYIRKHTNSYELDVEPNQARSGVNVRHMRLAHVYLMYAEAVLEADGDVNEAMTYIDMVRSRAGVKTIAQYASENGNQIPQLHISMQVNGAHPLVNINAENLMTHLRRVELPLELAFEGHRWKDLVRWGIVKDVFTQLKAEEDWRNANTGSVFGQAPLFISAPLGETDIVRPDLFLKERNYDPATHDYWPVPASENDSNNGVTGQ